MSWFSIKPLLSLYYANYSTRSQDKLGAIEVATGPRSENKTKQDPQTLNSFSLLPAPAMKRRYESEDKAKLLSLLIA